IGMTSSSSSGIIQNLPLLAIRVERFTNLAHHEHNRFVVLKEADRSPRLSANLVPVGADPFYLADQLDVADRERFKPPDNRRVVQRHRSKQAFRRVFWWRMHNRDRVIRRLELRPFLEWPLRIWALPAVSVSFTHQTPRFLVDQPTSHRRSRIHRRQPFSRPGNRRS